MKKVNKNLIAVALTIALAVSSFTGCGASPISDTSANTSKKVSNNTDAADTAKDVSDNTVKEDAKDASDNTVKEDAKDASGDNGYVGTETDTVQWFNATYAILTDLNGQDYNIFGGANPSTVLEMQYQSMLKNSWDVTDRESADETLDWILTEGHRDDFMLDGDFLSAMGEVEGLEEADYVDFLMSEFDESQEEAELDFATYKMYKEYGEHAIDAWDYCRALSLMSYYYMAGYYTKEEALDKSLEIANTLQPLYNSWDELVDSYLRGYEYWAEEMDSSERRGIYEKLLKADDNPFRVDYNITLEKTW